MMNRRQFCKNALIIAGGVSLPLAALELFDPKRLLAEKSSKGDRRWVFLVDIDKCVGCGFCVKACKIENEVPYEAKVSRTWVERYVITKKGETLIDSPNAARDGFTSTKIDQNLEGMKEVTEGEIAKAFFVPKLCNQCENPPCVQVCPVGATYQTADGVVLVDREWCIGCGYCIMGCPYGVRFFHPVYQVEEADTVRAPHDTVAAADAPLPVHEHDPVGGLISGPYRADLHAGGIFALVAEFRDKERLRDLLI